MPSRRASGRNNPIVRHVGAVRTRGIFEFLQLHARAPTSVCLNSSNIDCDRQVRTATASTTETAAEDQTAACAIVCLACFRQVEQASSDTLSVILPRDHSREAQGTWRIVQSKPHEQMMPACQVYEVMDLAMVQHSLCLHHQRNLKLRHAKPWIGSDLSRSNLHLYGSRCPVPHGDERNRLDPTSKVSDFEAKDFVAAEKLG